MCSIKLKRCSFKIAGSGHQSSLPGSNLKLCVGGRGHLGSGPQCLFLELVRKVTTRLSAPLKSAGPFPKAFLLLLFSEWALGAWTRLCGLLGEPRWKGVGAGGMGAGLRHPRPDAVAGALCTSPLRSCCDPRPPTISPLHVCFADSDDSLPPPPPLLLHVVAIRTMAPGHLPFISSQTATGSNGDMRIPLRSRRKKKSPTSMKPNSHFQNVLICQQWWKELSEACVPSGCPLSATPSFKSLLDPPA